MLVHRRDLHKHQRKVEFDIDELIQVLFLSKVVGPSFEYELENDIRLEQLQQILDHNKNTKEYFCSFKGDVEVGWITILDDNHPLVVQYFKQIKDPLPLFALSAKFNMDEATVAYRLETICFETKSITFSWE